MCTREMHDDAGASAVIQKAHAVQIPTPMATRDPFLFCVYHRDEYPAGDEKMRAPRRGNGADFDPRAPYRMYHGRDGFAGFPSHPHRGFETITATMKGTIDHADSQGCAGRYGDGDLQYMTAGAGIVHGEMFPLRRADGPNTLQLFQIWLNLPAKDKMVEPAFVMHWSEDVKKKTYDGVEVTIWTGEYDGVNALKPTPNSWAANPENDVGVYLLRIQPGASFTLNPAKGGTSTNRSLYFVEGASVEVCGQLLDQKAVLDVDASRDVPLTNNSDVEIIVLVLQGKPIGEPVAQHGPFVMNSRQEIEQAFADYRSTRFGGWPWDDDAVVFPREKGRFALVNGVESVPKTA